MVGKIISEIKQDKYFILVVLVITGLTIWSSIGELLGTTGGFAGIFEALLLLLVVIANIIVTIIRVLLKKVRVLSGMIEILVMVMIPFCVMVIVSQESGVVSIRNTKYPKNYNDLVKSAIEVTEKQAGDGVKIVAARFEENSAISAPQTYLGCYDRNGHLTNERLLGDIRLVFEVNSRLLNILVYMGTLSGYDYQYARQRLKDLDEFCGLEVFVKYSSDIKEFTTKP